jgi:DNA-binding GntR family transcriptional regulator
MINQREKAYSRILDSITYGELRPGERMVESQICSLYGVGRTPLREALRQLQMEHYVRVLPNKGAVVTKVSLKDIEEIYDIVSLLESYSVKKASQCLTSEEKDSLKRIQGELVGFGKRKEYKNWLASNALFHGRFAEITGNNHLVREIENLRRRVYRYRFIAITISGHIDEYIASHEEVLLHLFNNKAEKAAEAMWSHVQHVKNILIEFLRQYPDI